MPTVIERDTERASGNTGLWVALVAIALVVIIGLFMLMANNRDATTAAEPVAAGQMNEAAANAQNAASNAAQAAGDAAGSAASAAAMAADNAAESARNAAGSAADTTADVGASISSDGDTTTTTVTTPNR